ncbi:MAG: glycosyltransferase family 2 protein [Actinomycetota bacterium]|nr:glycosyltransferase family 2 protein [Actinomycetota bacterium]
MTDTKQAAVIRPAAALSPAPCVVLVGDDPAACQALARQLAALGPADLVLGTSPALGGAGRLSALGEELAALASSHARSGASGPFWRSATIAGLRGRALASFSASFPAPERTAIWYDARHAELLGFWREVLPGERPLVAVLATEPLGTLASRHASDAEAVAAIARRERWLRRALSSLQAMAVFVADAGAGVSEDLASFLAEHGVAQHRPAPAPPPPRRAEAGARAGLLLGEQLALDAELARCAGPHEVFAPKIGASSPWASALVAAADDLEGALVAVEWSAAQIERLLAAPAPARPAPAEPPERRVEGEDRSTPEDGGPYPLNAAEDLAAYHRWLRTHGHPTSVGADTDPPPRQARTAPADVASPLVSVVVPVYRPPLWALERCVGSVLAQDFASWQLVCCDDGSGSEEIATYLRDLAGRDPRISVTLRAESGGISAARNTALELATGEFVTFLDHDDELAPHALGAVATAIAREPEADVLYSDEDKINQLGERFDPFFKPEWSPDLLMSYAYLAHLTVIRRSLVEQVGGFRSAFDGSEDWDLALRSTERARRVVHVADILYHWRSLAGSTAGGAEAKPWAFAAGERVLRDALARRGEAGEVTQEARFPGRYHVRRTVVGQPLVSIIIPFRDEPALLATCAASLREDPGYGRYELVLVDNGSELPETAELLERLVAEDGVQVVEAPGPFNWPAINNAAARRASGDVLLFMNNDIEARVGGWLHALVAHVQRPEVGAVGGRLLYPDQTIQHAGVVLGLGGIAGHVLKNLPADQPGYASMAIQTRNCTVVTGACMMTRREVFDAVGGFDERLPVAFNDVDFCLKLREKGYLVVYEPLAELIHHESKSRGHTDDLVEGRRIIERWGPTIAGGDPYVNEHLSHWRYWCPLSTVQEEERWNIYRATHASTPNSSSST